MKSKNFSMLAAGLAAGLLAMAPIHAFAVVIIDGSTAGYYNAGLGDLATDSVLGAQTDAGTGFNLFPAANVSAGDPLIPPVASEPNLGGADAGTQTSLGNFLGNTNVLGGDWSATTQAIPATWAINDETGIVYEFDAGSGLSGVMIDIGVDNGVYVWLDGNYIFGAMAPGGASAGEYSINVGDLSGGTHFLQILREDHGGATGWSIEATGEPVPEPASLGLLGLGLALFGAARKRKLS